MIIHFIWFGSIPHPELVASIAAKMRYLKSMFRQVPDLKFYVWTTSDLRSILWNRFTAEHLITPNHRNPLNLEIKDIDELFSMKAPPLSPDDIRQLHTLFLREKTEPISNKAVAADMIKFLALFHFGGLYVDAGLTYADAFDEKGSRYFYDGRVMNIKEQRREFIRLKLTAAVRVPSSPQESTPLPDKNNKTELAAISNYGNSLLKIFGHYDYALTRFEKNREVDLQIMFFSKNANARKFLETLLSDLSSIDSDFKTSEAYDETYDEAYDDYRESKFKNPAIRGGSFTAAMYRKVYNTFCKDHRIYYFDLDSKRFKDFPRIHLKNSKTQKYENYRTSVYLPQDDTGFHSLFFPRGKKK